MKGPFCLLQLLLPEYSSLACLLGCSCNTAAQECNALWHLQRHPTSGLLSCSFVQDTPALSKLTTFWHLNRAVPVEANCTSKCKVIKKIHFPWYSFLVQPPPAPSKGHWVWQFWDPGVTFLVSRGEKEGAVSSMHCESSFQPQAGIFHSLGFYPSMLSNY